MIDNAGDHADDYDDDAAGGDYDDEEDLFRSGA